MTSFTREKLIALVSCASLLIAAGCGGGSGVTTSSLPPTSTVANLNIGATFTGALAGDMLLEPISVIPVDAQGKAVAGVQVIFSSNDGASFYPSTVVTPASGIARTAVRMPDTPLKTVTVNISTNAGKSGSFILATGPRVTAVYGNISETNSILSDGRAVGHEVLTANGALERRLGITLGKANCIEFDCKTRAHGNLIYVNAGPILVLDSQLNYLRAIDVDAALAEPNYWGFRTSHSALPDDVDANGEMYFLAPNSIIRIDSSGKKASEVSFQTTDPIKAVLLKPNGNFLTLEGNSTYGTAVREYDPIGKRLQDTAVHSDSLAMDSKANWIVTSIESGSSMGLWYDSNSRLIGTLLFDQALPGSLIASDAQSNIFTARSDAASTSKYDVSGHLQWLAGGDPQPGQTFGNYIPNLGVQAQMAADPNSNTIYLAGRQFTNGAYSQTCPDNPAAYGLTVGNDGSLYSVIWNMPSGLLVWDCSGTVLLRKEFPQLRNYCAIGVAPDNTKYLFDSFAHTVHVIDAFNNYSRAFTVDLPNQLLDPGKVLIAPDGNLVLFATGPGVAFLKKVSPSGAELWSKSVSADSVAVDGKGRIFLNGTIAGMSVLDEAGNKLGGMPDLRLAGNGATLVSGGGRVYWVVRHRVYELSAE